MSSRASVSKPSVGGAPTTSSAFELFHRHVQKWIWDQRWTDLRDIQDDAAPPILSGERDVLIASATASGKTEAAFLPIASRLADSAEAPGRGIDVLYVSPLKALINDQLPRLESLFTPVGVRVTPWHGDVTASRKRRLAKDPAGILLITPESVEGLFIRQGHLMNRFFGGLAYIVVDELHAFMGTERGRQLQSLLHRVEQAAGCRVPRIALSATLGDMAAAREFLRPGHSEAVVEVVSTARGQEVKLQVRGYRHRPARLGEGEARAAERAGRELALEDVTSGDVVAISGTIFEQLRGGRHLAFANRRADVELYADLLSRRSARERVPNEFWPHHGSLDRTIREAAEAALKDGERPATVIATTTLELGIDVGSVESIAQIGPPPSVASMRQRLGRSGRRGQPAILRVFVQEAELDPRTPPQDQLRQGLVQTVAMVELLRERWYEPPTTGALHLSTLVQQTLSTVAQYGGVKAKDAWKLLCDTGPFRQVRSGVFKELLRNLGEKDLLTQVEDTGELVLGLAGEQLVGHYDFYAAFATPEEYRIVAGSETLGTLPILYPLKAGMPLIFAGRRWLVVGVDDRHKQIQVESAHGGRPPIFGGEGILVHDTVRRRMQEVYRSSDVPAYLDAEARDLLHEGREAFRRFDLELRSLVQWGEDTLLFPWAGDREMHTLLLQLLSEELASSREGVALLLQDMGPSEVLHHITALHQAGPADAEALARLVANKRKAKHHGLLGEELLVVDHASSCLSPEGAYRALDRLPGLKA